MYKQKKKMSAELQTFSKITKRSLKIHYLRKIPYLKKIQNTS